MRTVTLMVGVALTLGGATAAPATAHPEPAQRTAVHLEVTAIPGSITLTDAAGFGAVLQVSANPAYAGDTVTVESEHAYATCGQNLTWRTDGDASWGHGTPSSGPSVVVTLDSHGNAIAAVTGGPGCSPGRYPFEASLDQAPFASASTALATSSARTTPERLGLHPHTAVEDDAGDIAVTVNLELPSSADQSATISSSELGTRCPGTLRWIPAPDGGKTQTGNHSTVMLDRYGNGEVTLLAGSCNPGSVAITVSAPGTQQITRRFRVALPACMSGCSSGRGRGPDPS